MFFFRLPYRTFLISTDYTVSVVFLRPFFFLPFLFLVWSGNSLPPSEPRPCPRQTLRSSRSNERPGYCGALGPMDSPDSGRERELGL